MPSMKKDDLPNRGTSQGKLAKTLHSPEERVKTGIQGLDEILCGGLPAHHLFLIQGLPGTGKTTLALQFLQEGVRLGQACMYVTLSESREDLLQAAKSHGWNLNGITFHELEKSPDRPAVEGAYTFYHPADVELGETTARLCEEVERVKPARVVIDSLAEMRLLAQDPLRYRRQIMVLKKYFQLRSCTVLLLDDRATKADEQQLQTIAHGVFFMENVPTDYGTTARRILIVKMRGVNFQEGFHDFEIATGGLRVYPRLNAAAERIARPWTGTSRKVISGIAELDKLLMGGMEQGTSALIMGPSGSAKSSLATHYIWQSLKRKEQVACYLFEESPRSFLTRAQGQGMNLQPYLDRGNLVMVQVDPLKLSPGEFSFRVKEQVEKKKANIVLIDSLNGYLNAMPSERYLVIQMYELLTYLSDHGVLTLLILAQHGLIGNTVQGPVDVSYLADTVILLRHFEATGVVKKAISVIKKRSGPHGPTIREFTVTNHGIEIGLALRDFNGVLGGAPVLMRIPVAGIKTGTG